jgi:hypothetical protein
MQAPRYTYLPLLIPEIRENLVELALDESQFGELDESGWWFEEEPSDEKGGFISQGPCKWCVQRAQAQTPHTLAPKSENGPRFLRDMSHSPSCLLRRHILSTMSWRPKLTSGIGRWI